MQNLIDKKKLSAFLKKYRLLLLNSDELTRFNQKMLHIILQLIDAFSNYIDIEEKIPLNDLKFHDAVTAIMRSMREKTNQSLPKKSLSPESFKPFNQLIEFEQAHDMRLYQAVLQQNISLNNLRQMAEKQLEKVVIVCQLNASYLAETTKSNALTETQTTALQACVQRLNFLFKLSCEYFETLKRAYFELQCHIDDWRNFLHTISLEYSGIQYALEFDELSKKLAQEHIQLVFSWQYFLETRHTLEMDYAEILTPSLVEQPTPKMQQQDQQLISPKPRLTPGHARGTESDQNP